MKNNISTHRKYSKRSQIRICNILRVATELDYIFKRDELDWVIHEAESHIIRETENYKAPFNFVVKNNNFSISWEDDFGYNFFACGELTVLLDELKDKVYYRDLLPEDIIFEHRLCDTEGKAIYICIKFKDIVYK